MQQPHPTTDSTSVEPLPDRLTSAQTKLVYLYLRRRPGATLPELKSALDMSALTVYPILSSLEGHGLVRRTDDGYDPIPLTDQSAR
jgi:DNA-binding MarR family transcriptional regulator